MGLRCSGTASHSLCLPLLQGKARMTCHRRAFLFDFCCALLLCAAPVPVVHMHWYPTAGGSSLRLLDQATDQSL